MQTSASPSRRCPGCGLGSSERFRFTVKGFAIWQCENCGLGRTDAASFAPERYYTGEYFSGDLADGYADYVGSEPVLRRQFAREVAFIRRLVPAGRLLEVGCAYGFLLQQAAAAFDVSGIELSEAAAQAGRARGLPVLSGVADEVNLNRVGMVDVIVMLDVIEHLPDPDETIARLSGHLRPGGIVLITTGDFASWSARLLGQHWRLMTPPQHLWFFTSASIAGMAGRAGLSVAHLDHPWKIVPLSLIAFQLGRMTGLKPRPGRWAPRIGIPVNLFDAMRIVLRKNTP